MPSRISTNGSITISSIELLTSQAATTRLGESSGLPDGAPVYLVTLQGSFTVPGPSRGYRLGNAATGYEVFDARTGNLMVASVRP